MFKHLLIPLDGSYLSEAVLPIAIEMAQKFNSKITLTMVIQPPRVMYGDMYIPPTELLDQVTDVAHQHAETYLAKHFADIEMLGIGVRSEILDANNIADGLLKLVDSSDIDGIIMSTHGRTGVGRWLFGSVAERILRHAAVPILLIRAQSEE